MLKIIRVPDESKFTEADLKPGLRVIRKIDGAECVVTNDNDTPDHPRWFILRGHEMLVLRSLRHSIPLDDWPMLDWLNRDFRRADSPPQYKTVGKVPVGVMFDTQHYKNMIKAACSYSAHNIIKGGNWNVDQLGDTVLVTRVHGPLTIDPSVTEGV